MTLPSVLLLSVSPSSATSIHGTLHEYCVGADTCRDTGAGWMILADPSGALPVFGISASPDGSLFDVHIVLLIPADRADAATYDGIGADTGLMLAPFSPFSFETWSRPGQDLIRDYLGLDGAEGPAAQLGSYLDLARSVAPATTGFYVYRASLGSTNFQPGPTFAFVGAAALPQGSVIASYATAPGTGVDGTVTGVVAPGHTILIAGEAQVPEPGAWQLLGIGAGLIGVCRGCSRRQFP